MERQQAFTVLPPLSPRLPPPPPTPAETRMAPRTVAHRDNSAFVILAELGDPPSGRSSPFRGRGFRVPSPPSRIPILSGKSAPSSPVRSKIVVVGGKSAPASPKRVTTKPPQPRKRNESPSQLTQNRRNSPASTLLKDPPNRRLTAKPPVPKPISPRRNASSTISKNSNIIIKNNIIKNQPKTPQPAKRDVSKPMPAVRTRLNNKPVSTDLKIGLNNKSERPTLATPAVVKRSAEKLVAKQKENKNDRAEIKEEVKKDEKETQKEMKSGESVVVSATPAESASVHKINELNLEKTEKKIDEPKEDIVKETSKNEEIVRVEVEPEKKDATETILAEISGEAVATKAVEEVKVLVNGGAVKDSELTEIVALDKAVKETKVEINGLVGSGDPTLVEWTTKQPMELAQPDIIPTDSSPIVGVKETTVEGPPEVEVEAGNHTVTFRSPEIHPVSPRVSKAASLYSRISERMVSCCKRDRKKMNVIKVKGPVKAPPVNNAKPSIFSRLFKWKRKPRPPPKPKAKGPKTSLFSRINCCKGKGLQRVRAETNAMPPTISTVTATPPPPPKSVWRTVFCLDKACCAKCKRNNNQDAKKKEKTRRSSSIAGFPKLDGALVEHTSVMKGAIPVMPICLAWFCLLLNVFLPGIGTIISGFLCTCFGKPRFSVNDSAVARLGSLCVNVIVGISQMFTILFCLVGWGWSIWWGVIMVRISRKNRRIKLAEKASESNPAPVVNQNHDVEHG